MPAEAKPYKEGSTWSMRKMVRGEPLYVSGHPNAAQAREAMAAQVALFGGAVRPFKKGPFKTTLAEAMFEFALSRLPRLKGARQESGRINTYLRLAGLPTVKVVALESIKDVPLTAAEQRYEALEDEQENARRVGWNKFKGRSRASDDAGTTAKAKKRRKSKKSKTAVYFEVQVLPPDPTGARAIPNGLHEHRAEQASQTATCDTMRRRLAMTSMAEVTRYQVQELMDRLANVRAPATVEQERALLRRLFNYARVCWHWSEPEDNPGTLLDMPTVDNERKRTMSREEEALMAEALKDCRSQQMGLAMTLLTETAMRTSEPLLHAHWKDVDLEKSLLRLSDGKTQSRYVPLSPRAVEVLKELKALSDGDPEAPVLTMTYEALKAAWKRACERAGIEDLTLYDLRRTGATRVALEFGNVFLVQALTGHKTMEMVMRYTQAGPDDLVKAWKGRRPDVPAKGDEPEAPAPADESAQIRAQVPPASGPVPAAVTVPQVPAAMGTGAPMGWSVQSWSMPSYGFTLKSPASAAAPAPVAQSVEEPAARATKTLPSNVIEADFARRRSA